MTQGFLFVFRRYCPGDDRWHPYALLRHFVTRYGTGSEMIHVEMIPVWAGDKERLTLGPDAYTSFVGQPFVRRDTGASVGQPSPQLVFAPCADPMKVSDGVRYLQRLIGTPYVSFAWLAWVGCAHLVSAAPPPVADPPHATFCSQVGALLLRHVGLPTPAPAFCTPGDLYDHLLAHVPGARVVDRGCCVF